MTGDRSDHLGVARAMRNGDVTRTGGAELQRKNLINFLDSGAEAFDDCRILSLGETQGTYDTRVEILDKSRVRSMLLAVITSSISSRTVIPASKVVVSI
jgi:hypothetical protein